MEQKLGTRRTQSAIKKAFKILPVAAIAYIIYRFFQTDLDLSKLLNNRQLIIYIFAAIILYITCVLLAAFNFVYVLKRISKAKIPFKKLIDVYLTTNLYKYLPGNVFHYLGRNTLANSYGIPHTDIAFASIFEVAGNALVFGCYSIFILGTYALKALRLLCKTQPAYFYGGIGLLVLLTISTIIFYIYSKRIKTFLGKLFLPGMGRMWFVALLLFSYNYLICGFSYYLILKTLGGIPNGTQILFVIAAHNMAWLAGFITPGAPGGIGVKEFVLLFLFGPIAPENPLLLSLAIYRIALTIADIIAYSFKRAFS